MFGNEISPITHLTKVYAKFGDVYETRDPKCWERNIKGSKNHLTSLETCRYEGFDKYISFVWKFGIKEGFRKGTPLLF